MFSYYIRLVNIPDDDKEQVEILTGVVPQNGDVRCTSMMETLEQAALLLSQTHPEIPPDAAVGMIITALARRYRRDFG